jgi:hypothetical protein
MLLQRRPCISRRLTLFAFLGVLVAAGAAQAQAPSGTSTPQPLVVHEWGTFTSIAGPDGRAVEWLPLDGPIELPRFVNRFGFTSIKGSLPAKIRMETPVLYFYAPGDTTVNVTVRFRQGPVTEWFPRAEVKPANATASSLRRSDFESGIRWTNVKVSPGASEDFPREAGGNHYYVARETDASPLQLDSDTEKSTSRRRRVRDPTGRARADSNCTRVVSERSQSDGQDLARFLVR